MTMMDERPAPAIQLPGFQPAPITVDRGPDGALHMTAMHVKHEELLRYGHRAMKVAQAIIADEFDVDDPPEFRVEVVVHYMW